MLSYKYCKKLYICYNIGMSVNSLAKENAYDKEKRKSEKNS